MAEIVVRYFLLPKKVVKLAPEEFTATAKSLGAKVLPYDASLPYEDQKCDVLLNKLTDYMVLPDDPHSQTILQHFIALSKLKDGPKLVDGYDCQLQVLSRDTIAVLLDVIERSIPKEYNFKCPKTIRWDQSENLLQKAEVEALSFPRIIKTVQACGSSESHIMSVVLDNEAFQTFKPPMLVQEYYNHNGTVYKIFVIGETFQIVRKASVKNFYSDEVNPQDLSSRIYQFDSQKMPCDSNHYKTAANPPEDFVKLLVHQITTLTKMSLYGFDLITNCDTGQHAVIDINYFPSYAGFPEFHQVLTKYLISTIQ